MQNSPKAFRRGGNLIALLAAAWLAAGCGGGGGGSSPTAPAPPPIPSIAGSWSGTFHYTGLPTLLAQMQINQSGGTISNSTVTHLAVTLNISGTINSSGKFLWQNVPTSGGCGTLKGDMQVAASGGSMSGTVELNSLGCPNSGFHSGTASLSRSSSTAVPEGDEALEGTDYQRALRDLEGTD